MRPSEEGSALVECILVALLLLVPLIWLLGVLSDVHRGALASAAAAREAGADAARTSSLSDADHRIDVAVARAFADQGLDPDAAVVHWTAAPDLARGGAVEIEVTYPVPVFQAPFLGRASGPAISVTARHVTRIDPYRSRG